MATAGGTYLLVIADISNPLRAWLGRATMMPPIGLRRRLQHVLHRLLKCTYCTSVWVAMAVTPAYTLPDWRLTLLLYIPTFVGAWIVLAAHDALIGLSRR